jgi:transposase
MDRATNSTAPADRLFCAIELSKKSWLLGIQFPDREKKKRAQLLLVKGIGPTFSAVMAREVYYRQFSNRRQVAGFLGLATSPYDSGQMERYQGHRTRHGLRSKTCRKQHP